MGDGMCEVRGWGGRWGVRKRVTEYREEAEEVKRERMEEGKREQELEEEEARAEALCAYFVRESVSQTR